MAEVGMAFLSAILGVVFNKMDSPGVADFIRKQKSIDTRLKKMKIELLPMNKVLEDAEEKQVTDPIVQTWIDELKDVAYTADDILDEIATEALQRNLDAEFQSLAGKVRNSISGTFIDPFVHQVEQKIKEILDRLGVLREQMVVMGLKEGVGEKQDPERLTNSDVKESNTFGRVEDKKKIIDSLLSSDAERDEKWGVIAIVGIGGIGKTTLAQLVYNDSRVKQHFNLQIWICVSEDFVVAKTKKSIIEAATLSTCNIEDPERLQVTLMEKLNGKKFFLVLDDVWSEKPIHREFLEQLLQYGTRGSKILVTTRNASVARAMHADSIHHLEQLPERYCGSLFENHAFRDGSSYNADPKIKEIGRQIVNKCKGLPLAIKAIGDLLWSESNVESWTIILKSDLWDESLEKTEILPALRLSYKYLPSYLKRCFAYCSIFPKDYIFEKNELVLLWMAEGFLKQSTRESMEEVGNRYFHALVSRSFFQQSSATSSSFVMHDLVNDLANFVSGQFGLRLEGDNLEKIGDKTRYLSFINLHESEKIKEGLYKAKQLRTFLALDSSRSSKIKTPPRAWCLRTLSISGKGGIIKWLIDSINNMKHLRYLDVSFTSISRLPNSICMLCNLQTLKLSCCWDLERLPRDMWKLINLRHLEFDGADKLKEMPVKMGRLKCLQTLTKFIINKNNGSRIGELGKLMNLRGKLLISELQNVRSVEDSLDEILKDKVYLEELVLEWNHPEEFGISESHERSVFENLQPHENLKSLAIYYYGGKGFPDWLGGLPSLSMLELKNCKYCCTLPPLGQLPSLTELFIDGLDGVVTVDTEFYRHSNSLKKPFERLKLLKLNNMSNWENWFHLGVDNEVETFSQLRELYIKNCPKLRGKLPVHLPSLSKLEISNCEHLEGSLPLELVPKLTQMSIKRCDNLESLALAEQHEHGRTADCNSCLVELHIHECSSLVSLPRDGLFSTLKRLEILNCKKLELPTHWQYSSLEELWLENSCDSLTSFPLSPTLKVIRIRGCSNLQSLEQHEHIRTADFNSCLVELHIIGCSSLVSLPMDGLFSTLKSLKIRNCKKLELPTHRKYSSLEELELFDCCDSLRSFPLHIFPNLKEIIFDGWKNLQSLEQDGGDLAISGIEIRECPSLVSFSKEGLHASNLVMLVLYDCESLRSMPDKMHLFLPSLHYLEIGKCPEVESFPEGGLPSNLKEIEITDCKRLIANWREWGLERLPSLESLEIGGGNVESFPGQLLLPTTLIRLRISSFSNLKSLEEEGFQHLISLESLDIFNCHKLEHMPEVGFSASLCFLSITRCFEGELERKEGNEWLKVARVPNILIDGKQIQGNERWRRVDQERYFRARHKKIVLKLVDLLDERERRKAMKVVCRIPGIDSIESDMQERTLTVIGNVDLEDVVEKLRKFLPARYSWRTESAFLSGLRRPKAFRIT